MRQPEHRSTTIAVLLAALCSASCGKRGDPLPPLRRNPQPVQNLTLAQRGTRVEVAFTTPAVSVDGLRLEVLEAELFWAEELGEFSKVSTRRTIRAAAGEKLSLDEPLPPVGTPLRVAVRTQSGRHESMLSPIAALPIVPPPLAPSDLSAGWTEAGARLSWVGEVPEVPAPVPESPPPGQPGESPALAPSAASPAPALSRPGFLVYRRDQATTYSAPLFGEPLAERSFVDATARRSGVVCYVVRAVLSTKPLVESDPSPEACLAPP